MDQTQQRRHAGTAGDGYDGDVPPASAQAQQAASLRKKHGQRAGDDGYEGGVPAASARAQQAATGPGKKHEHQQKEEEEEPASALNPTAARLLREAIVSQPDGGEPAAAVGSSDILAFSRAVDRVDSPLE